jgi:L-rhamnose mutarotase
VTIKRISAVTRLRPENETHYLELHKAVWPEVLQVLRDNGITNYSIFLLDGLLFSYLEFVGESYEEAELAIASNERTLEWWKLTAPCQEPLASANEGDTWSTAAEVFHLP